MRRSFLGRVIPAAFTAIGVAIPSATAALVMLHTMISGSGTPAASPTSSSGTSVAAVVTPTPQPAATATSQSKAVTTRTIAGPVVSDPYGQVQATITVTGSKITNVSITAPENDPKSAGINQYAVPVLRTETLQAKSASVDLVSGATITSNAYIQSLQGALQTAGL